MICNPNDRYKSYDINNMADGIGCKNVSIDQIVIFTCATS